MANGRNNRQKYLRVITCPKDCVLTVELLEKFLRIHRQQNKRYKEMVDEYEANAPILRAANKPNNKPDNRLVTSHGRYMVNMFDGFFIGKAVKVQGKSDSVSDKIAEFESANHIDEHNAELAKLASVYGTAIELVYQDEASQTKVCALPPSEAFIVYDNTADQGKLFGVHVIGREEQVTVSTAEEIVVFQENDQGNLVEVERQMNPFEGIPMVEYSQNTERIGLFEPVITLIDKYNKALSEKANDVDYFADAYLKVIGVELSEKEVGQLKSCRTINLYKKGGESAAGLDVGFLEKPNADETQEHLLDRLEKKIFQIANVVDLTDERFGAASGIAREMKLQGMANQALMKERKFQRAMEERYRLFFSIPLNGKKDDWVGLKFTFYRNLPQDLEKEAAVVRNLKGIVSDETLLSYLSNVDDPREELERLASEYKGEEEKPSRGFLGGLNDDTRREAEEN